MKRNIDEILKNELFNSNLWISEIKNDCINQNVFLAIRNNQIDFYHKGGRLFNFDKSGFKTHFKYASVIESTGKDYLIESELRQFKLASDFKANYSRIQENCSNYTGIEALGVSDIYHKHSYLSDSNVVVLDLEVSFESLNENNKQDRIDILFLNKQTKTLQFVEAKHYSNKEIWSNGTPKVISQIKRYESQINKKKSEILSEFTAYVRSMNSIFGISLPEPIGIDDKVTLLIFGFDNDQKKGRLKDLIIKNSVFNGIKSYQVGNVKQIVTENLWNTKEL